MPPNQPGNAVLLERIENVRCDVNALTSQIEKHIELRQEFLTAYTRAHTALEEKTLHAHGRIDKIETQIGLLTNQVSALEKSIQPLVFMSKVLSWLSVVLGTSIVALIWGILTHQVTLVFP